MRSLPVLAWIGAAVLCTTATAQTPTVRLRHQRKMGEKWTRNDTGNYTMLFNALGTASDGTVTSDSATQMEVVGVGADGSLEVRRTGTETTHINGIPNAPAETKREMSQVKFVQDTAGKLVKSEIPPLEINQQTLMDFGKLFSYETDQIPPLEWFPDKEVSVGEEWAQTYTIKAGDGKDRKITVKSHLFSYNPTSGEAWIVSETETPGNMKFGPELGNLEAIGKGSIRDTYLFNVKEGKTIRGTSVLRGDYEFHFEVNNFKVDISMSMSGAGTMNQQ